MKIGAIRRKMTRGGIEEGKDKEDGKRDERRK